MKSAKCIALTFLLFSPINSYADTCTPAVSNGKVLVEIINGDGKTVFSEQHQLTNKSKYNGLLSSSKIYNLLKNDKSGKIKLEKSKLSLKAGGLTTKALNKDGTAIAKIGGCSISKINLYTRLGKQKKPFLHQSILNDATTTVVSAKSQKPLNPAKATSSLVDLKEVFPQRIVGANCPRIFQLNGSGFSSDMEIVVSTNSFKKELSADQVNVLDDMTVFIKINTTIKPDKWAVQIKKNNQIVSNQKTFIITERVKDKNYGEIIGTLNGVLAKSNGDCTAISSGKCDKNYETVARYQCVNLAKKYYASTYTNISDISTKWGSAQDFWERPSYKDFVRHKNYESKILPKSGDLIFFDTGKKYGHVAIVSNVSYPFINIIQENLDRNTAKASLQYYTNPNSSLNKGVVNIGPNMIIDASKCIKKLPVLGWLTPRNNSQAVISEQAINIKSNKTISNKINTTKEFKIDNDAPSPFGIPLGIPFSKDMVKEVINYGTSGKGIYKNYSYEVIPKIQHPYFIKYKVFISPDNENRIYNVSAYTNYKFCEYDADKEKICKIKLEAIANSLIKKYGKPINYNPNGIRGLNSYITFEIGRSNFKNAHRYYIRLMRTPMDTQYGLSYIDLDMGYLSAKLREEQKQQEYNKAIQPLPDAGIGL